MRLFLSIIFASLIATHALAAAPQRGEQTIRVALWKSADQVEISIRGQYKIVDALSNRVVKKGRLLTRLALKPEAGGLLLGEKMIPASQITIQSSKDITFYFDGKVRRFRGDMEVIKNKQGKLLVINHVELERYIRGVLYHEVSHRWPMEVIKVQAVAARSYALYQKQTQKNQPFDVSSDIYSQVYGGKSAERYRTNLAAKRTQSEVLTFEGNILPAYFHATCGGQTEDVKELWNHDLAPLKGIACDFCSLSPHYRWRKNFRSKDVQEELNQRGYHVGLIKEIMVTERTKSGRIKNMKIVGRDGKSVDIPGKVFREAIGPNNLKSNFFDIEMKGYYFDVIGKGWGHGVGMCQWGAYGMALKRYKYKDILLHYYPGADIKPLTQVVP